MALMSLTASLSRKASGAHPLPTDGSGPGYNLPGCLGSYFSPRCWTHICGQRDRCLLLPGPARGVPADAAGGRGKASADQPLLTCPAWLLVSDSGSGRHLRGQGAQVAPATALPSPALRNPEAETTGRGAQTSARYGWWEGGTAGHWGDGTHVRAEGWSPVRLRMTSLLAENLESPRPRLSPGI